MSHSEAYRHPVGPVGYSSLEEGVSKLARVHNDTEVRRRLTDPSRREMVLDANSGEPVINHVYRLDCGHLMPVWLCPLPDDQVFAFCGEEACRCERRVVEHLT